MKGLQRDGNVKFNKGTLNKPWVAKGKAELYYRDIYWDFPLLGGNHIRRIISDELENMGREAPTFLSYASFTIYLTVEPSVKILILLILIILLLTVSQLDLHFTWQKNSASCSKKSLELEGAFLYSAFVAWLSRKSISKSHSVVAALLYRLSLCLWYVLVHRGVCASQWHGTQNTSEAYMSIYLSNSLLWLRLNTLLLSSVSLAFLWYVLGFCAFCSFVIGFCSCFVALNVWREPGDVYVCLSGLYICYMVACDCSDRILCLCFPIQCFCFNILIVKFIFILYLLTPMFIFAVCCVNRSLHRGAN